MNDLAETIQRWDEFGKQKTSDILEKILQEAQKLLNEGIEEGETWDEMRIRYDRDKTFVVELVKLEVGFKDPTCVKKTNIPYSQKENVITILNRVMEKFKSFPQLEVRKKPFAVTHYDTDYNIVVRLKE